MTNSDIDESLSKMAMNGFISTEKSRSKTSKLKVLHISCIRKSWYTRITIV